MGRQEPGVLKGAFIPFVTQPLGDNDQAFNILATSVIGSIAEQALRGGASPSPGCAGGDRDRTRRIQNAPNVLTACAQAASAGAARICRAPSIPDIVLDVNRRTCSEFRIQGLRDPESDCPGRRRCRPREPTRRGYCRESGPPRRICTTARCRRLAELLKPAAQRVKQFKIGPAYDTDQCRPRRRADAVRLHRDHDGLQQSEFGQQQLRP